MFLENERSKFIVFDFESTGFAPMNLYSRYNRVIQISAKSLSRNGKMFDSFVNPGFTITKWSQAIHHIGNEHVSGAPSWKEVWQQFLDFFKLPDGEVFYMIAHNCYGFDQIMMEKEFALNGMKLPDNIRFIDTLPIFKDTFPAMDSYSLGNLYKFFYNGLEIQNQHRSDSDVHALRALVLDILKDNIVLCKGDERSCHNVNRFSDICYMGLYRSHVFNEITGLRDVHDLRRHLQKNNISPKEFFLWISKTIKIDNPSQAMHITGIVYGFTTKELLDNYHMFYDDVVDSFYHDFDINDKKATGNILKGLCVIRNKGYRF